jgi:hypothetical protein
MNDKIDVDEFALLSEAKRRAPDARSAFDLILRWDVDIESVRARRGAVDQVTALPVMTRDLRNAIAAVVGDNVELGPSVNQVRRRLGAWFRLELRDKYGPVPPDQPDFTTILQQLGAESALLAKQIPERSREIVHELIAERAYAETNDVGDPTLSGLDVESVEIRPQP